MPRISAEASQSVAAIRPAEARLQPRSGLPAPVAAVFYEVVQSVAPGHLRAADRPIVEELARAIVICREAGELLSEGALLVDGEVNPLAKLVRAQQGIIASLSTKLRLTAQSRMSKDKAGSTTAVPVADIDFHRLNR